MKHVICILILAVLFSCNEDPVPKPKAFLRLDYPQAKYVQAKVDAPFSFETNLLATKLNTKSIAATTKSYGINIEYPLLKGTIFLTYKAVERDKNNLMSFLRDAQNLPKKHMIKADGIFEEGFEDSTKKVYGRLYQVEGNAASQSQFYVTDSVNHFLTGSLYFHAKPNYDSILPASNYLQKDIQHIMETIVWK